MTTRHANFAPGIARFRTDRLFRQLDEYGVTDLPALPDAGEDERRLSILDHARLWRHGLEVTGDDLLGVRLAERSTLGRWGELEYLLMSAADLMTTIDLARRYWSLLVEGQHFALRTHGRSGARLELTSPYSGGRVSTQLFEGELVYIARFVRLVFGELAAPREVHLVRTRPSTPQVAVLERALGAPVRFGRPVHALVLREPNAGQRGGSHHPALHAQLRRQVEARFEAWRTTSLLRQLEERLRESDRIWLDVRDAARAIHLSVRTLQRRLEEHGTTWRCLRDDVRRREAIRLLEDEGQRPKEVAYRLGYAEPSSFRRALVRWQRAMLDRDRQGIVR